MLTTLTKLSSLSSTAFLLLAGDPFTSTQKFANDTIPKIQLIATAVFALVLAVTGLVYAFSGQDLKQKIKKKWVDVGVAIVVVYGATMIITWGIQFVQNSGFK
ncbi:TrbC/VirB2 family protein [Enterococcus cecorum]